MDNQLVIPQHISFYGLISGQFILFAVLIGFLCKHYYLCLFGLGLYVTTMLHWSKHRYDNIMYLDILITNITLLIITFYYAIYFFKVQYRNIWLIVLSVTSIIFALNEYFYLNYIENNPNMEYFMQINVFIHIMFLHILLPLTYIYCSVLSL